MFRCISPGYMPQNHRTYNRTLFLVALFLIALCCLLIACAPASPVPSFQPTPDRAQSPTLDDFWNGDAHFEVEVADTGLPMGESDTIILSDGTWRSYAHASYQSLGVLDQCGAPVEFPGCLVIFSSTDQGRSFSPALSRAGHPVCQIPCTRCPCDSRRDHIDQQQYPRVARHTAIGKSASHSSPGLQSAQWLLVYEYRANTILRRSSDGLAWSAPAEVPLTGIWRTWLMPCRPEGAVGIHPYAPPLYDCLIGSPPGIYIDDTTSPPQYYIFLGLGQNPGGMGCYRGPLNGPPSLLRACDHTPLFVGAAEYGPLTTDDGTDANAYFDFRTVSSADLVKVGERYYLFYEGVRGPGPGDAGDTQFLLGLARSTTNAIDGPWELYPGNPILLHLPGNVGVGHADVVTAFGETYLYTSLDGIRRSRLRLVWN